MRRVLKALVYAAAMAAVSPWVGAERLARKWAGEDVWFEPQAEWLSLVPGRIGVVVRAAFYHLSLSECPLNVGVEFGAVITHSDAALGRHVYIGMRSIVGRARIGDGTLLADHVQVLSGARHHLAADPQAPRHATPTRHAPVRIGRNCWIGAQAVLMADVGNNTVVGAGSIVTRPLPDGVTAVGNPARVRAAAAQP